VTGPSNAESAILVIYDIFGFFPQIIQGADILAYSDEAHPKQVFMPAFFGDNPADISWYPPDTDEKGKKLGAWFETAAPPKHLPKVPSILEAAEKLNSNIKSWGVIGYCWGGKMVSLIGTRGDTKFKAGVQTSPAMVDPEEAKKVQIPMLLLPSKDEGKEEWDAYAANLTVKNKMVRFDDQPHGWMSARGDLKDEACKKDYEKGYKLAADFFNEYL
jgi:dienelactone hydrolase